MARQIKLVVNKFDMNEVDQSFEDMNYWLSKTPQERLAAVTFLINQNLKPGQRMDKTKFSRIKMK
ncbi:MAG: hypothetical protein WBP45_13365 [Daejeonella sp.]